MFHWLEVVAQWGQSAAVSGAAAAAKWPRFSRDVHKFPQFMKQWKSAKVLNRIQQDIGDNLLCDIMREKCMPQLLTRRMMYFRTMQQIWDFLEATGEKPCWALEECPRWLSSVFVF